MQSLPDVGVSVSLLLQYALISPVNLWSVLLSKSFPIFSRLDALATFLAIIFLREEQRNPFNVSQLTFLLYYFLKLQIQVLRSKPKIVRKGSLLSVTTIAALPIILEAPN